MARAVARMSIVTEAIRSQRANPVVRPRLCRVVWGWAKRCSWRRISLVLRMFEGVLAEEEEHADDMLTLLQRGS